MSHSHFFNPNRTQPFLITFFQAVLAFRRMFKKMKIRLGHRSAQQGRHESPLHAEMKKSQRVVRLVKKGKTIVDPEHFFPDPKDIQVSKNDKDQMVSTLPRNKTEELFRNVSKQINNFHLQLAHNRVAELEGKLDQMAAIENDMKAKRPKSSGGKGGDKKNMLKNTYFQSFSTAALVTDENDETKQQIEVGEYLEGTHIYFGATIALQARHGGFLSYNSSEVKASAHKVMHHSRFIVKKSDDLTEIGTVNYGDALWLQSGPTTVLGARYGSLVDQKREIQPSLISCKRQHMFKAQQYGRWIVLNRDDPMGKLGQPIGHLDRVILEQEWYFLASTSPYESSMYKSLNNSDEAMTTKIDLFRPGEECSWKVHLVALPIEDSGNEQQRQQLLQDAKDQIDKSEQARYEKAPFLLGSLADKLPARLSGNTLMNTKLKHKKSPKSEQEYLYQLYKKIESNGFQSRSGSVAFLSKTYGPNSPITLFKASSIILRGSSKQEESFAVNNVENIDVQAQLDDIEEIYWDVAQKLLINTKSWVELPQIMDEFEVRDVHKKVEAARVLQKWIRKHLEKRFNYERAMRRVDRLARTKLEEKSIQRRKILMEHTATAEIIRRELQAHAKSESPETKKPPKPAPIKSPAMVARSYNLYPEVDGNVVMAITQEMVNHNSTPFLTEVNTNNVRKSYSTSHIVTVNKILTAPSSRPSSSYGTRADPSTPTSLRNKVDPSTPTSRRPLSASSKLPTAYASPALMDVPTKEILHQTMLKQIDQDYALPKDVFDDLQCDVNAKVGLKFL